MKNPKILKTKFNILEKIFGIMTLASLLPQIYKLLITKRAQDFSISFIFGMIIVNFILFIIGFANQAIGLMIGTLAFILYNLLIIYYYFLGIK